MPLKQQILYCIKTSTSSETALRRSCEPEDPSSPLNSSSHTFSGSSSSPSFKLLLLLTPTIQFCFLFCTVWIAKQQRHRLLQSLFPHSTGFCGKNQFPQPLLPISHPCLTLYPSWLKMLPRRNTSILFSSSQTPSPLKRLLSRGLPLKNPQVQ